MKPLYTSLKTAHWGHKPSPFLSSSTHSFQVFLFFPLYLTPATSTFWLLLLFPAVFLWSSSHRLITTIWNTRQGRDDRVRVGPAEMNLRRRTGTWPRWEGCGNNKFFSWKFSWAFSFVSFFFSIFFLEHFLESLKGRWWPDIGWQAIPDQGCSGVKCKRGD